MREYSGRGDHFGLVALQEHHECQSSRRGNQSEVMRLAAAKSGMSVLWEQESLFGLVMSGCSGIVKKWGAGVQWEEGGKEQPKQASRARYSTHVLVCNIYSI